MLESTRLQTLALGLVLFLPACSGPDGGGQSGPQTPDGAQTRPAGGTADIDLQALELVEDATESLANQLLELSVAARSGDASRLVEALDSEAELGLPLPGKPKPGEREWLFDRPWTVPSVETLNHEQAGKRIQALLDHFEHLEDVRFKLTGTVPEGRALRSSFKGYILGRNAEGQREWLKFTGRLSARPEGEAWKITGWVYEKAKSMVATLDVFSECGLAAGLGANSPSYAERSEGLRSHGAATADVNGDGLLDLFATGEERNYLYLNKGDGTFRELAKEARLRHLATPVVAPLFVDHDADGDLDLFITAIGPQVLLENRLVPDGRLVFRDVSSRAGVNVQAFGFSVAAGDVNADGWVDLYVASYNDYGTVLPDSWERASNGAPNRLFMNQGDGRFVESARELGVSGHRWSYATTIADLDEDGALDIIVANDFGGPMAFYRNLGVKDGQPSFRESGAEIGLGGLGYGMGLSLGDHDNDGDLDLHLTKMSSTAGKRILGREGLAMLPENETLGRLAAGNSLFENLGGGRFKEVTKEVGPLKGGWAWGGGFLDIDNDGHQDLYTPNGYISGSSLADT